MILKLKMKDNSKKNIEKIKMHFYDASDKITAGYIIGLAVERTSEISDDEWKNAISSVLREGGGPGRSTSVSLRQEIFERIGQIKDKLERLCGKPLYTSQVIDIILAIVAEKLNTTLSGLDSLTVMEWNINARSCSAQYSIPVNLICNEVIENNPHIFVLTEFVRSVGYLDLKAILEEKYHIFESPYCPRQNGICIGIRKECGIEYLGSECKSSIFAAHLILPDFYEVKVRIASKKISVVGTRIRIDYYKANAKNTETRIAEQRQRFEQYTNLISYIAQLENVIVLGDFNCSRVLGDEKAIDERSIETSYHEKDSIEHNYQKLCAYVSKKTSEKMSLYTPDGDRSSVGAFWDNISKKAKAPISNKEQNHKYDHVLTNFQPQKVEYNWAFLDYYDSTHFEKGRIKSGYPDHALLLATIAITSSSANCEEESL